jgi:hypothetical protein
MKKTSRILTFSAFAAAVSLNLSACGVYGPPTDEQPGAGESSSGSSAIPSEGATDGASSADIRSENSVSTPGASESEFGIREDVPECIYGPPADDIEPSGDQDDPTTAADKDGKSSEEKDDNKTKDAGEGDKKPGIEAPDWDYEPADQVPADIYGPPDTDW